MLSAAFLQALFPILRDTFFSGRARKNSEITAVFIGLLAGVPIAYLYSYIRGTYLLLPTTQEFLAILYIGSVGVAAGYFTFLKAVGTGDRNVLLRLYLILYSTPILTAILARALLGEAHEFIIPAIFLWFSGFLVAYLLEIMGKKP
jgi:drug/metabolite transporter (DMT)-like permease